LTDYRRGAVVTVAVGGGMGHKPRPAIVVQHDEYANSDILIVVPLTGEVSGNLVTRPVFQPDENNGLLQPSRLMTNRIAGTPIANVGKAVGFMSADDMGRVDEALSLILGLEGA
jgi:mRNA interferase MazF